MRKTFRGFGAAVLVCLRFVVARLSEPSTYAGLGLVLGALHVSLSDAVLRDITTDGMLAAGAAAVVLREAGKKGGAAVAADVIAELATALRQVPAPVAAQVAVAPTPEVPAVTATVAKV